MNTITSDNGKEFAKHESIARNMDIQFFFAHPSAFWERGLNEDTNRLIKQYYPKKSIQPYLGSARPLDDGKTQLPSKKMPGYEKTKSGFLQRLFIYLT